MFKDVKKKAEEKTEQIKEGTSEITNKVSDKAKDVGEGAAKIATGAVQTVAGAASSAGRIAKNAVDSVVITLATKIVIKSMKSAGNKGTEYLFDDEKYEKFIGRTWEMLPLPVRLIGKDSLGYNTAMFTLRKLVFGKDKAEPKVDKTDEGLIKKTIKGMFR